MPLVDAITWSKRLDCGQSFPSVSISSGLPAVDCRAWGGHVARIKFSDASLSAAAIADGFQFTISIKRRLAFQKRASLTFPGGEVWTPEGGLTYTELTCDQKLDVADKDGANYVFPLTLELAPGVALKYQGPLAPDEIADGCVRPDWAIGSYAVFHADGRKLGHIPRPFITDSKGATLWGSFRWIGNVLAKVFDAAKVDALTPPLRVDDTFGYTAMGASQLTLDKTMVYAGQAVDNPANSGTVDSITWCTTWSTGCHYTQGVYADSSGPASLLGGYATADTVGTTHGTKAWETANFNAGSKPSIVASTQYHLGFWTGGSGAYLYYDASGGIKLYSKTGQTYVGGTMPNPFPSDPTATNDRKMSIYGTYTVSGGGFKGAWAARRPQVIGEGVI